MVTRPASSDAWFYPSEFDSDLRGPDLPAGTRAEVLACAWEYVRCVVPEFTSWERYVALVRIIAIGIVAEFHGDGIDAAAEDRVLGYDLDGLLESLFGGSPACGAMAREYRTFLIVTDRLLFPGLLALLRNSDTPHCRSCRYRGSYGADRSGTFGGVELCDECRAVWRAYLVSFPARAARTFSLELGRH